MYLTSVSRSVHLLLLSHLLEIELGQRLGTELCRLLLRLSSATNLGQAPRHARLAHLPHLSRPLSPLRLLHSPLLVPLLVHMSRHRPSPELLSTTDITTELPECTYDIDFENMTKIMTVKENEKHFKIHIEYKQNHCFFAKLVRIKVETKSSTALDGSDFKGKEEYISLEE